MPVPIVRNLTQACMRSMIVNPKQHVPYPPRALPPTSGCRALTPLLPDRPMLPPRRRRAAAKGRKPRASAARLNNQARCRRHRCSNKLGCPVGRRMTAQMRQGMHACVGMLHHGIALLRARERRTRACSLLIDVTEACILVVGMLRRTRLRHPCEANQLTKTRYGLDVVPSRVFAETCAGFVGWCPGNAGACVFTTGCAGSGDPMQRLSVAAHEVVHIMRSRVDDEMKAWLYQCEATPITMAREELLANLVDRIVAVPEDIGVRYTDVTSLLTVVKREIVQTYPIEKSIVNSVSPCELHTMMQQCLATASGTLLS